MRECTFPKTRLRLQEAPDPNTSVEVSSFLGLLNFVAHYVPNLVTCDKMIVFFFGDERKRAFNMLKESLSKTVKLSYFILGTQTSTVADVSLVGIKAVL